MITPTQLQDVASPKRVVGSTQCSNQDGNKETVVVLAVVLLFQYHVVFVSFLFFWCMHTGVSVWLSTPYVCICDLVFSLSIVTLLLDAIYVLGTCCACMVLALSHRLPPFFFASYVYCQLWLLLSCCNLIIVCSCAFSAVDGQAEGGYAFLQQLLELNVCKSKHHLHVHPSLVDIQTTVRLVTWQKGLYKWTSRPTLCNVCPTRNEGRLQSLL